MAIFLRRYGKKVMFKIERMTLMKKQLTALMLATSLVLTACGASSDDTASTVTIDPDLGKGMSAQQKETNDKEILDKVLKAVEGAIKDTGFNKTFEIKIENGNTKVVCSASTEEDNSRLTDKIAEKLGVSTGDLFIETAGKLCMDETKGKGITVNTIFSDAGAPTVVVFCTGKKSIQKTNMAGIGAGV